MNRRELFSTILFAPAIAALGVLRPKKEVFDLALIDKMVERAKLITPVIKPVKINGKLYYVMPVRNMELLEWLRQGDWRVW